MDILGAERELDGGIAEARERDGVVQWCCGVVGVREIEDEECGECSAFPCICRIPTALPIISLPLPPPRGRGDD